MPDYEANNKWRYEREGELIKYKMGFILTPELTDEMLETFENHVSWAYNYTLKESSLHAYWMNENEIEFMPMIKNTTSECDMRHDGNDPDNFCSVDMLVHKIEDA